MIRTLIGGVGYRWMRDASFGLVVSDMLARERWPGEVEIADLGYGALYVTLDLLDKQPSLDRLVLIAATVRDRPPGTLSCTRYRPELAPTDEVQARVREAGAGVIDLDHLLAIAQHFGALPNEIVCLELEPVDASGGTELTDVAAMQLPRAGALARQLALGEVSLHDLDRAVAATCVAAPDGASIWR